MAIGKRNDPKLQTFGYSVMIVATLTGQNNGGGVRRRAGENIARQVLWVNGLGA
jgi:hypothetical protein